MEDSSFLQILMLEKQLPEDRGLSSYAKKCNCRDAQIIDLSIFCFASPVEKHKVYVFL